MNERLIHLKIKIKNLADESRLIRHEERKLKRRNHEIAHCKDLPIPERERMGYAVYRLQEHRKGVVRRTARHNLLAYGFLRGRPYEVLEPTTASPPDWNVVEGIAKRFGLVSQDTFTAWKEAGKAWLTGNGPSRHERKLTPLSPEAQAARRPRPPEELVGALQDQVHVDVGRARPVRTVKIREV